MMEENSAVNHTDKGRQKNLQMLECYVIEHDRADVLSGFMTIV